MATNNPLTYHTKVYSKVGVGLALPQISKNTKSTHQTFLVSMVAPRFNSKEYAVYKQDVCSVGSLNGAALKIRTSTDQPSSGHSAPINLHGSLV
jgi:hypothetical protein